MRKLLYKLVYHCSRQKKDNCTQVFQEYHYFFGGSTLLYTRKEHQNPRTRGTSQSAAPAHTDSLQKRFYHHYQHTLAAHSHGKAKTLIADKGQNKRAHETCYRKAALLQAKKNCRCQLISICLRLSENYSVMARYSGNVSGIIGNLQFDFSFSGARQSNIYLGFVRIRIHLCLNTVYAC